MLDHSAPLILGSRATFANEATAELTGFEVDESWEILNISVSRGFLRWAERVRLPFSAASQWTESSVALSCTAGEAFAREIPPIAAPARPIGPDTQVAVPGARVAGALVIPQTRRITNLIVRLGRKLVRVGAADVTFEGKTLHLGVPAENLPEHRSDDDIVDAIWRALHRGSLLTPDELRTFDVVSSGGAVTLSGAVRRKSSREYAGAVAAAVPGITSFESKVTDDLQLETDIGRALDSAGVQRVASVYARSSLGDVTLYGSAPSLRAADDAVRATERVSGVRSVRSRIEAGTTAPAAT